MAKSTQKKSTDLSVPVDFVGEKDWFFLYWVALYTNQKNEPISTPNLCKKINLSQQTISRRILKLEKEGYLERAFLAHGGALKVTPKGYLQLQKVHLNLKNLFIHHHCEDEFEGLLKSGLGEGAYYIKHPKYLKQFEEKLGFKPYFGTLNVQLDPTVYEFLQNQLESMAGIVVEGFQDNDRNYGNVQCVPVELWTGNNRDKMVPGALLRIQRTSHLPYLIEFIAEQYIREYFQVEDDNKIRFIAC